MEISKALAIASVTAVAMLAGLVVASAPALAKDGMMQASMVACPSDKTVIGGVNACGKIWSLGSGMATLQSDGKLHVELHGLVLNDASVGKHNGSPDGVDAVAIAVVCGGGTSAAVAGQAEPVPLSQKGDADIDAQISMPAHCFAPVILARERYEGKIGGWLAATGF